MSRPRFRSGWDELCVWVTAGVTLTIMQIWFNHSLEVLVIAALARLVAMYWPRRWPWEVR